MRYDMIVVGSGAAGCAAALEARKQGLSVLLIDDSRLSATGLLRSHGVAFHQLREAIVAVLKADRAFSAEARAMSRVVLPLKALAKERFQLAAAQSKALRERLDSRGVRVESGPAQLVSTTGVRTGSLIQHAEIIVIDCESGPRQPGRFQFDGGVVCDFRSVFRFVAPPRSMLVLGAEEYGCALACLFAALGTQVTLLDRRSQMLRYVDRELAEILHTRMQWLGVEVVLSEALVGFEVIAGSSEPHANVRLASGRVETFEKVLVAAGRGLDMAGLSLERAGVATDEDGFIVTDEHGSTTQPGVYAAGDAVSGAAGLMSGDYQGRVAVRRALGLNVKMEEHWPMAVYSIPEIAMVGFTEEMCERLETPHVVGRARFGELLAGHWRADPEGMLKLVVGREDGRLLGVQAIGAQALELIQLGTAVMQREETAQALARGPFNSPSLFEAYRFAAVECLEKGAGRGASRGEPR